MKSIHLVENITKLKEIVKSKKRKIPSLSAMEKAIQASIKDRVKNT